MKKIFSLTKLYKNCKYVQKMVTERNRGAITSPFVLNSICFYAYKANLSPIELLKILKIEYELNETELEKLNSTHARYLESDDKEDLITCQKVAQATKDKFCSECNFKECLKSHADFYDVSDTGLQKQAGNIPDLDINIIPIQFLRELLINIQNNVNAPKEYLFISLLTVLGAVIGLNFYLKLDDTWNVYSSLLSVLIGEPSSKKSPSMKVFIDVLNQIETETNTLMCISNTTVEGVCKFMHDNNKAVLIACDELKGWLNSLGEYKGKSSSDRQFYLSAWNCERFVSLRKTTSNIVIPHTHVSLLGSTQPQILKESFKYLNTGDGFIERILWVIPTDYLDVGKYIGRGKGKIDKLKLGIFKSVLREIIVSRGQKEYILNEEDERYLDDFEKMIKSSVKNSPKYSALYGKATGLVGKFALIFQVFKDVESRNIDNNSIQEDVLKGAIEVTKYFLKQFITVVEIFSATEIEAKETIEDLVYKWLIGREEEIKAGFMPSLISTYKVGKIYKAEEAKNLLDSMIDKGRIVFNPVTKKYQILLE